MKFQEVMRCVQYVHVHDAFNYFSSFFGVFFVDIALYCLQVL